MKHGEKPQTHPWLNSERKSAFAVGRLWTPFLDSGRLDVGEDKVNNGCECVF